MSTTTPSLNKLKTDYYADRLDTLKDVFGTEDIALDKQNIIVNGHPYPVVDDVIILLDPSQYPPSISKCLSSSSTPYKNIPADFAEDIQFTFGAEWLTYSEIMPEHEEEFALYFDIVDLSTLNGLRVCDLGCGIGRWSHFLTKHCKELILLDFSEAIFAARNNLKNAENAIFFMGDLKRLPFRSGFADFLFCLGVLHHLPVNALKEVKALKKYAPTILIYLYYALDNKPFYYEILLEIITWVRKLVSKIRNPFFRSGFSCLVAWMVYLPLVHLGKTLKPFGLSHFVPIYDGYNGKTADRIKQDVYDRFFTRIEQRFTKNQILKLQSEFEKITISPNFPYWHFKCENYPDSS